MTLVLARKTVTTGAGVSSCCGLDQGHGSGRVLISPPTRFHAGITSMQFASIYNVNQARRETAGRNLVCLAIESDNSTSEVERLKVREQLNAGIARFYDSSTGLWEEMWGDHLHHGYYQPGVNPPSNRQAQVDMIENVLEFAEVTHVENMVDVGCGLGGSSRHLAKKYGCTAKGITLSPYQAKRGNEISDMQGLRDKVELRVADALDQPFEDNSFDLVWSLESGEHMPDKEKFVNELVRVAAPGGRIIIVTWCHRSLGKGESKLKPEEKKLLDQICEAYYLPEWCSIDDYKRYFEAAGLENIKVADWSEQVSPFWGEVIKSALTVQGIVGLIQSGWSTLKGALVMPLMAKGLKTGLVRFNLITGTLK